MVSNSKAVADPVVTPPVVVTPPPPAVLPTLPSWTDAASISSYLTTVLAGVFAVVTYMTGHGEPVVVQAVIPSVGVVIAGIAQIVNVITHRGVQKAAFSAS